MEYYQIFVFDSKGGLVVRLKVEGPEALKEANSLQAMIEKMPGRRAVVRNADGFAPGTPLMQ